MPYPISAEPLAQMLRSITLQKRTGFLRVEQLGESGREQGEVYFEGGRPMRAQAGQENGKAALKRISSWKHITCSFDGVSRSYAGYLSSAAVAKESETGKDFQTRPARSTSFLNDTQQRTPLPQAVLQETGPQRVAMGKRTLGLSTSESVSASVNPRSSISTEPITQSFLFNGDRLSEVPQEVPPSSGSFHNNLHPALRALPATPLPRQLPATPLPRQLPATPLPVTGPLPGRMAIFRPVPMIDSAKSIQRLERRDRLIFILLDGCRTIRDIAQLIPYSEEEVEQTLVRLTQRGYTERVSGQHPRSRVHEKMVDLFSQMGQNEP